MPRLRPVTGLSALSLCLALSAIASNAEAFRIVNWNILNYPGAQGSARETHMRTVLAAADPDILVVQEMQSAAGVTQFLTNVLNALEPGQWSAAPFIDGPDTDNALFYRTASFDLLGQTAIPTSLRHIMEYRLRAAGYGGAGGEFRVYSAHLKAGATSADETQRLAEATAWRNFMNGDPAGTAFVACGDFNIRSSNEASYQKLLEDQADDDGRCHDPISTPGTWYNNAAFVAIHTQSTRTTSLGDGGATGGMDDRFDFMLSSAAFDDGEGLSIVPGTYTAFGQDGQRFNSTVNALPANAAVGQTVADALYYSSDHLPLFADFQVPARISAPVLLAFGTVIVGAPSVAHPLAVGNDAAVPGDELNYTLAVPDGYSAAAGPHSVPAGSAANQHAVTMATAASGDRSGVATVASNDVDRPSLEVALTGAVLAHAEPSLSAGSVITAGVLDFGTHAPGGFLDRAVAVHDYGFHAFQAALEIYGAEFAGDPRFSLAGGFSPSTAGASPASYTVRFDDAGAADGDYTGTLTFQTRDPQGIPGAQDRADLVIDLAAHVSSGAVSVADGSPGVTATRLYGAAPNPLRWPASIRFDLAEAGPVRLQVFDVRGRLVRTLVDSSAQAGAHEARWDGRDTAGRAAGSGVYFVRMVTARQIEMHPAVVAR